MNKYLRIAWKLTHESSAKQQKMAAVVVRGGAVISVGVNRLFNHAERRAIRKHMDYEGADIYVARKNRRLSKPCPDCRRLLIKAGIRRAFYFTQDGFKGMESYA